EIPSPVEGTVEKVHVEEGTVAVVGDTLITIDAEGYESDGSGEDTAEEVEQESEKSESKETTQKEEPKAEEAPADNARVIAMPSRSEEHTSELQSRFALVCHLLPE